MGSLDQPTGSTVKRKVKLVDVTGKNAAQIETFYNSDTGPGSQGWRIIQFLEIGSNRFIVAEKEA